MKVLLVEDDASLREGMVEIIDEVATVRAAGTMAEALEALESERYALVLTDLRIAGGERDGRTILETARRRLQPVAIVSASTAEDVARALRPYEPDAVLVKPFQLEEILALVERFLSLRRAVEQAASTHALPAAPAWTVVSPGVGVTPAPGAAERPLAWVRMEPGASFSWQVHRERQGVLLVEGDLEVGGERFDSPRYFFVSAGQAPEARTRGGCLAVSVPLRG